ncbi:muramidase family protein [Leptolinea tardivitalis]|uniref:muramidase family protein n=1 Tax=Leptolinea tardivitalis TaxID=229920 RepID=UPI00078658A4|nr:LysM domain-containing protein [Leptolinea tardivitalis]GAP22892.1 protein containing FOG: LysM repeat [Leptolinea tardivitalis]
MAGKENPQNVIDSYKKRQQSMPFLIGGLAGVLILGGVLLLVFWLSGPNKPDLPFLSTKTSTPTLTFTASPVPPTSTPTETATLTLTVAPTETVTPSGPFEYTVVEGDYCQKIADQFSTVVKALVLLNPALGANCNIRVGEKILIPQPGAVLPTDTPIPQNIKSGTLVEYTVEPGDTIGKIASKFNSVAENILTTNKLKDANLIYVGQVLKIPVNIVTIVPTRPATITPGGTQIGGTKQPAAAATVTATKPK